MKKHLSKILISVIMVAIFMAPISAGIKIDKVGAQTVPIVAITTAAATSTATTPSNEYGCGLDPATWFTNCIALVLYETIFNPLAGITRLTAEILDFFVYYSTDSDSYASGFVTKAWGAVRDVANIFFIIALLYVAIKTILGLNVTDNKRLISAIVVVALVINFSLFVTKVVIDSSNILAKVFYNNITSVDKNGAALAANAGGEKSISVGLVSTFDPHKIFLDANGKLEIEKGIGQFILVTLLSIAIMIFMIYIFLSVALLFVGRVVSLWISMIFSPIAFISYTVPFDIPGFGHKEWWKNLIENAMLAPLFIFFLYIIIMFGDFLSLIRYDSAVSTNWVDTLMKTIIPFFIIFMLLKMAKGLAVKYSGEMGKAITSIGAMAGGLALGAATGGMAFAGRQTLGRVATNLAESETLKNFAAKSKFGSATLKMTRGVGAGSFDARGIKIGGKSLANTGLTNLGKAQAGGFTKERADAIKRQEEFANKALDTGDYGKAELSKGGMSVKRAANIIDQMERGGPKLSEVDKLKYQMELTGHGIETKNLSDVARRLSAARRSTYADKLEKRKEGWGSGAGVIGATNRIAANKIRKDAKTLKEEGALQHALEHLAHEINPHPEKHEEKQEEKHKEESHEETHTAAPSHTPPPNAGHTDSGSGHGEHH